MNSMKEIIMELRQVRIEKGLSYGDISDLLEQNGDHVSKSTISRIFSEGSTDTNFSYDEIIRPIANVLLDIDKPEDEDDIDTKTYKSLLKFKSKRIEELEAQIETIKAENAEKLVELHEKMDMERAQWSRSIEFLKEQINYKDKRIDFLLDMNLDKDAQIKEFIKKLQNCPYNKE